MNNSMNNKTYTTLRRVMMTVAMAAGVCIAAWGQGTTTTVVQAGSGVTKIAVGQNEAKAVINGDAVQAAEGATVTIVGAAPAAGQVARLKLTRMVESSENGQTGENPSTTTNGQTGENPSTATNGQTGGSGTGQSFSLESVLEITYEMKDFEMNIYWYNLPDDIRAQLPENGSIEEIVTLKLENYTESTAEVTKTMKFPTMFVEDETVWILFAGPEVDSTSWFVVNGKGQDDGSLQVKIPAKNFAKFAGKTFAAFVFVPGKE